MKIRTRGNQAFNVPNNDEGQTFLKLLRKFRNRGWRYRARGRGPRKIQMVFSEEADDFVPGPNRQYSLPQEESEWMAVYLEQKEKYHDGQWINKAPSQTPIAFYHGTPLTSFCGCDSAEDYKCEDHRGREQSRSARVPTVGMYVVPKQIMEMKVAEWSSPFTAGSPIALALDGRVYNPETHGLQPGTRNIGFAVEESKGAIGEGEGIVCAEVNPLGEVEFPNTSGSANEAEESETMLDADELVMLEKILTFYRKTMSVCLTENQKELLDNLCNKLID